MQNAPKIIEIAEENETFKSGGSAVSVRFLVRVAQDWT